MIIKDTDNISYKDIDALLKNKIDESDTLDYEEQIIDDCVLKHVCAFANTRGGDIVFGIKESGRGGHPVEIPGLDTRTLNKERIEQIILSNIAPRLDVGIRAIAHPDNPEKTILLVRVPDSYLKPHQNNQDKKYYKRFRFEAAEMTEQDICDCYRRRFTSYDRVERYVDKITKRMIPLLQSEIYMSVVVIPSDIEHRIIDTSDYEELKWLTEINPNPNLASISSKSFFPRFDFYDHGVNQAA